MSTKCKSARQLREVALITFFCLLLLLPLETALANQRKSAAVTGAISAEVTAALLETTHQILADDFEWGVCQQIFWPTRTYCHGGCTELFPVLAPVGEGSTPSNDPNYNNRDACFQVCDENYNSLVTRCNQGTL